MKNSYQSFSYTFHSENLHHSFYTEDMTTGSTLLTEGGGGCRMTQALEITLL